MKKSKIIVPKGIRYISQWGDFNIPRYPHILNKQIPGCGFTEYCITNQDNVVLCSPRKILLENKRDQHESEVLYINGGTNDDSVSMDKDLSKIKSIFVKTKDDEKEENDVEVVENECLDEGEEKAIYKTVYDQISSYIKSHPGPKKILVTYDSFHMVRSVLENLNKFLDFQVIIDEFQSIFIDSKFKSSVEMKFLSELQGINNVCYVSATPMIDSYLELMDEFKDLDYYDLDWETADPGRIKRPTLKIRTTTSVATTARTIIDKYKSGNYEHKYINFNGQPRRIESKEAVIYVNSVTNIISIIKRCGLVPREVNILCARTPENRRKIGKKLGNSFTIGRVPLKGEPRKMFTFCTRTVYLGADFYSDNARTFVISDANIDSLAVDISLDLPQIMGRQRLDSNPWKNEAEFYYRSTVKSKTISKEEFDNIVAEKYRTTEGVINDCNEAKTLEGRERLAIRCEFYSKLTNYLYDYVALESIEVSPGVYVKQPTVNRLVMLSERRAFDIQQIDYADRFSVFNVVSDIISSVPVERVRDLLDHYLSLSKYTDKLKFLCELDESPEVMESFLGNITENHFVEYYTLLGPDRIKACGYNITVLNRELGIKSFDSQSLVEDINNYFTVGERYSLSDIKSNLQTIYKNCGYDKSPQAKDLSEWFELQDLTFNVKVNGTIKRTRGYRILSKK